MRGRTKLLVTWEVSENSTIRQLVLEGMRKLRGRGESLSLPHLPKIYRKNKYREGIKRTREARVGEFFLYSCGFSIRQCCAKDPQADVGAPIVV